MAIIHSMFSSFTFPSPEWCTARPWPASRAAVQDVNDFQISPLPPSAALQHHPGIGQKAQCHNLNILFFFCWQQPHQSYLDMFFWEYYLVLVINYILNGIRDAIYDSGPGSHWARTIPIHENKPNVYKQIHVQYIIQGGPLLHSYEWNYNPYK